LLTCCPEAILNQLRICSIVYEEDAVIRQHTQMTHSLMLLNQMETMYTVMSPGALPPRARPHKHYPGSTAASAIMGVRGPDSAWKMTVAQKRTIYGPDARTVDVMPDYYFPTTNRPVRDDSDIEPVNYWGMTHLLYAEIIHRLQAKAVIDLTASDVFAVSCIEAGIPYLGLCLTSQHVDALTHRLMSSVFQKCTVDGNPLYRAKLAHTLDKLNTTTAEPGNVGKRARAMQPAPQTAPTAIASAADDDNGNDDVAEDQADGDLDNGDRLRAIRCRRTDVGAAGCMS
jgi:hypothetical protein